MKYYLLTYQTSIFGLGIPTMTSTITVFIKGCWVEYCRQKQVETIIFLKEITAEEYMLSAIL